MQCNPASQKCHLRQCDQCGSQETLKVRLQQIFDDNCIDAIEFKKWTNTDRSNLESLHLTSDEFIEQFCNNLEEYQFHDFLTKMQGTYYRERKMSLKAGEVLVICDFAENYSFTVQDEVQSYHWSNQMATVHPFVLYYNKDGETTHLNFAVISECNIHNTIAVHLFQSHLIKFIKDKIQSVSKIIYFSDGCAAQYKNCKNFLNLCYHKQDFGIDAEWHFFTTSHGKGPCDGIGGTIKRLATKASLQRPYDRQILTPKHLYTFAKDNICNIHCHFSSNEEYQKEENFLRSRHLKARTVTGTHSLHHVKPLSLTSIEAKHYSLSECSRIVKVTEQYETLTKEKLNGFVTIAYDSFWWLAYIVNKDDETGEATVSFLHPHGPNPSFVFPSHPDVLSIAYSDIMTKVDVSTTTGRTYHISEQDSSKATKTLEEFLQQQSV